MIRWYPVEEGATLKRGDPVRLLDNGKIAPANGTLPLGVALTWSTHAHSERGIPVKLAEKE